MEMQMISRKTREYISRTVVVPRPLQHRVSGCTSDLIHLMMMMEDFPYPSGSASRQNLSTGNGYPCRSGK